MMNSPIVCQLGEVANGTARGFLLMLEDLQIPIIVVNWNNGFQVYLNRCPHTGVELNWLPDQFFDLENEFLQCSLHGALFRPDDGLCIHGPCNGQHLTRLEAYAEKGSLRLKNTQLAIQLVQKVNN